MLSIAREFFGDSALLGEVGPGEEVGDRGALLRLEEEDDRLATELVLERDVVLGDLGVGVEVRVLSGGELGSGEPDPEDDRTSASH